MPNHGRQDDTPVREMLDIFGLTDKEIDVYLALLTRGEATTSTVADDADVSQQAVYDITERLEDRGLVRINEHASPKTITAVPPDESMAQISDEIERLTPALNDRFNEAEQQAPELKMVHSRKTAIKRLRRAISQAQREILLAIPEHVYPDIEAELAAALDRDVLVFVLIQGVDASAETGSRFAGTASAVRCWDEYILFLYAVDVQTDDEAALIGGDDLLSGRHEPGDGVAVSQSHLTSSIHGLYLGAYWPAGTEVYTADPDTLPKTYGWFRQAVFHAMLHVNRGVRLEADVETASGETLTGTVSDVRQAFVEPTTSDFTLETALVLETDDGVVSVGGPVAIIEDYVATSVTLRRA